MSEELSSQPAASAWSRVWPLLLLTVLWQLVAMQAHSRVLPTPLAVFEVLVNEVMSGELLFHLGKTMARVAISFCLAMLLGVGLGILMGRSRRWDRVLDSLLILGLNIPALVTTIEGCNHGCTYCNVPFTRGAERHRPWKDILLEVEELVARKDQVAEETSALQQEVREAQARVASLRETNATLKAEFDKAAAARK